MEIRAGIGVDDVRDIIASSLPGYQVDSVARLGEGLDNVAFLVNDELIVRWSTEPDPERRAALVDREARLLDAVARISPLAVPRPRFVVADRGCMAYAKLPGVPLLDVPATRRPASARSIAATLGEFLAVLHAVPVERMADLVEADVEPPAAWRRDAAAIYGEVAGEVPAPHRGPVEAFLDAEPPDGGYAPVFSHNDLGIEHVLVDPAGLTVSGVIDWSDAAIVDPAYDLGLLYRDLGPDALDAALGSYLAGGDDVANVRGRAVFYARCSVFEDLAYGMETGKAAYADKSRAAMAWLFPS